MKTFRFILLLCLTLALGIALNTKIEQVPPLGKFLSPFHGFWLNAENQPLTAPSQLTSPNLSDQVNIHFDDLLIPHIFAQNESDLLFAQGYITAFHRLWQMEMQLIAADGRVSELIGEVGLKFDRTTRRIGLGYGAKKTEEYYKKEKPEFYKLIESYTAGVNTYINSLKYKDLPIEYKLLDYKPEPWTPYKCFLLVGNMSNTLSRAERDLENTNALKLWGREVFDILYPERHPGIDPMVPRGTAFDFEPIEVEKPNVELPLEFTDPTIEQPEPDMGSNMFVVNGNKTANGKVILANEPDLSLNAPSLWYVVHLNAPGYNSMGGSLPGGPGVLIGYNDSIAWGLTNSPRDMVDWYKIEFKDESRDEYLYNDNWVPTRKEIERFEVRGGDTFNDTVIYTHIGPVVYDRNFRDLNKKSHNVAMRWTAHDVGGELEVLNLANKAKNFDEFLAAFKLFNGPPQNFSFGAVNGDIAIRANGKFPLRWQDQGKFLMDGSDVRQEWNGFIPQDHNPMALNPEQNFVSSGNQHAVDSLYPYYNYDHNYEYYRGRRLNDRLRVMENVKVEDMMKLQHDNFNYQAFETLPMMLDSLDSTSFTALESKYFSLLTNWDYFNEPDREAPSVYKTWWDKLRSKLWEEMDSSEVKLYRPSNYNTYYVLKNYPDFSMIDNTYTPAVETSGDLFRITFKETIETLEEYLAEEENTLTWYKFKNTSIRHLLGLAPFGYQHVKIGGYRGIVNAASERAGPSWRMVVELGDGEVNAWGVYPGSQSANPGNPTYGHMVDDWASGQYRKMLFKPVITAEDENIIHTIGLIPGSN